MWLGYNEQNEILEYLRTIHNISENSIVKCKSCSGTGLLCERLENIQSTSWGGGFCDKCNGYGRMDWVTYIRSPKGGWDIQG